MTGLKVNRYITQHWNTVFYVLLYLLSQMSDVLLQNFIIIPISAIKV